MSDTKVYQFGEQGSSSLNALLPFLQQRGIDPAYIQGLMNNGNGGFFGNNALEGIIALIVVAAIFGGNGNGGGLFGGGGNNNNAERELLAQMIQRNGTDLSQLAQSIGCSNARLQDAIGQISTQLCNFAGQTGSSFQQVINAIQSGNNDIVRQLCDCCCKTQNAITTMGYENQLAICQQTNTLVNNANTNTLTLRDNATANTNAILGRLDAMEKANLYDKIDSLREKNSNLTTQLNLEHQNQYTAGVVAQSVAPINAALRELQSDVDGIKCKLPRTETVVAQPNYIPLNYSIPVSVGVAPYCGYGNYSPCGYGC